ncbi:CPBP family intramembrane glutamic endopeptidase [Robertmurraya korlensis]|uniref:CPBP family intramembrane glutamic endopeptidase n=1 Tax=Robertmurraya korlensis TaxID=519977 RepID=UPI000825ACAE|nr:type II CAAX endopeptidase family protein [Robertmurraya korlensis]
MLQRKMDLRMILAILLAHVLLFITFQEKSVFWYIYTATMLFLITYSILHEEMDDQQPVGLYITYGVLSGVMLFVLFFLGNSLLHMIDLPLKGSVAKLYKQMSPTEIWQYIVLFLIIIPGEEVFWRGFILKRLLRKIKFGPSILISTLLYTSVNIYSGSSHLILASIVAGLFWSSLYVWKRSIPLLIVSHIVFDLILLVLFPLR